MSRASELRAELVAEMSDVQAAIQVHGEDLLKIPGVISVQPGYRFKRGRITREPAVVVRVDRKRDKSELEGAMIPAKLGKVVVDVLVADPLQQLRVLHDNELAGPGAAPEPWRISTALPDGDDEVADDLAGPMLPYVPPANPASEVDEEMTVVCHSSCDNGFRLLKGFFDRTEESMVSTMYEFTAPYIMDALLPNLADPTTFDFIFDGKNKRLGAGDMKPTEVKASLEDNVGDRLTFAWAANSAAGDVVSAGFFPNAYHIKVSVRDGKETWLSSGNWKDSGQPEADPFNQPNNFNKNKFQRDHNREWHVLIDNENLASQFATYIKHDIEQALPLQLDVAGPPAPEVMPDLFVPVPPTEAEGPPTFFPELTVTRRLRAVPLFTPDSGSYFDFVSNAIANARHTILFENQSLSPRADDETYQNELFLVLSDKSRDDDIDVKIIVRGDYDPELILTKLQAAKFNMDRVRLLGGVHTKGIIIDNELVVIGSHNWTGAGTRRNRDASVVFFDPEIIEHYTKLFEYDWNRADPDNTLGPPPMIAPPGEEPPEGFVRVPWTSVIED